VRQTAIIAHDAIYKFDRFKSKKDEIRRPLRMIGDCCVAAPERVDAFL